MSTASAQRNPERARRLRQFDDASAFAASEGRKITERTGSGLVAGRREQVSAAANRPDHGRLGGIDLDLAANSHDPKVNGAIERLAVAGVRELQKPLARQHAF